MQKVLTGNQSVSWGVMRARAQVIAGGAPAPTAPPWFKPFVPLESCLPNLVTFALEYAHTNPAWAARTFK